MDAVCNDEVRRPVEAGGECEPAAPVPLSSFESATTSLSSAPGYEGPLIASLSSELDTDSAVGRGGCRPPGLVFGPWPCCGFSSSSASGSMGLLCLPVPACCLGGDFVGDCFVGDCFVGDAELLDFLGPLPILSGSSTKSAGLLERSGEGGRVVRPLPGLGNVGISTAGFDDVRLGPLVGLLGLEGLLLRLLPREPVELLGGIVI